MLPFGVLLLAEGVLRVVGLGGAPPLFRRAGPIETGTVMRADFDWPRQFFFRSGGGAVQRHESAFIHPKPEGTVRIAIAGASFAQGWPHGRPRTAAAVLERTLQSAWPGVEVEVLNLGIPAIASFPVVCMVREALGCEPDLVIVCTGHNEFYGAYGVASLHAGTSPRIMRLSHRARGLAVVQALGRVGRRKGRDPDEERQVLVERMAAVDAIGPDDALRRRAEHNLGAHLREIVRRCDRSGVPLVLCTLPSNERDIYPIGTDNLPPVAEPDRDRFNQLLDRARGEIVGDPQSALDTLTQAERLWADHAALQHALARAYELCERHGAAAAAYRKARDLDPMPWRAPSRLNDVIREVARENGVALADVDAAFRDESVNEVVGWDLMTDHVHPSVRGQALVAHVWTQTVMGTLSSPPQAAFGPVVQGSPDAWHRATGDTLCEQYETARRMRFLFSLEPLAAHNRGAAERFAWMTTEIRREADPLLREALTWWSQPAQDATRMQPITGVVGKICAQEGRFDLAEPLLALAWREPPRFSSGRLDYMLTYLTCRAQRHGRLTEEDRALGERELADGEALASWEEPETHHLVLVFTGSLAHLLGHREKAVQYLEQASALKHPETRQRADLTLCQAYLASGRPHDARRVLAQAREDGLYGPSYAALERQLNAGAAP